MKKKLTWILGESMIILLLAGIFWKNVNCRWKQEIAITNLQVCHTINPLGLDEEIPDFSWRMESDRRGAAQSAYRIYVADSENALKKREYIWDSGKIEEACSVGVFYQGKALKPKQR